MPFVISKDPIEGDFDSDTESKFVIGGEVTPDGSPIYDEDDILTKAGWRYRKKTTDTDMVQGAAEAVKGLWNGFAKIPELVRSKGLLGAANNIPEGLLAAGEGWADIVKTVASKNYAVVTGMSEEQDLDRQYDNYREVAERSVAQVKRSRSRVGDFFRAIGAPEQAVPYDESIDQETSNALSMVLDPTNLIGGGSLKSLLAVGKGGKVAVAGEKAAVAGEKALQAAEKVSAEVAEKTAKGLPPIGDGPAPINFIEAPSAAVTGAVGKGAENVGKFGTSVGEKLSDWQKANPLAAPIASAALAGYGSDWDPLAIIGGAVAPSAIKASATKLKLAGEAAQVAAVASREGLDVAAKSGIAGEKVSAIAKRLDTPAVNFLLSQSAQLADAVVKGSVIGGGLGYAVNNDPEVSGLGSGIGGGIVGGGMGRLQSIGIDQAGRVAFHRPDADGKWVRVSESPAALAKDQDLAISFLASRSLPERTALAGRLNIAELAELARGEAAAKGANRVTGSDMEVRFLDSDGMVAAGFDPTVAKVMQGVTETDQKPTLYINLDVATDPAYTLWHEGMHGFDRLAPDEVGGKQTDAGAALEQTRAELKAFYFGSYDASGKQTAPGKYDEAQFLKLEDQYLSRLTMSEAEMTAHMGQPMSKRVAYIADEMAAEAAGMLGRLSGGDIGKASRYPSTALGRAALGVLGRTRIGLESLGIVFDGGGEVVTSGIFKDPTTGKPLAMSNDVREKLSAYLRAKDKITTRMSIDFDESPISEVVNARDLAKASTTPETLARWKNSGMFALDDKGEIRMMGGKPVFLTAAERKKVDANRSLAIFTAIKAVPDDGSPGLRSEVIDGVETFKGTKLNAAQVDAVLALPDAVLPPSVKARISELVKLQEVPGGPVIADYNKAITGGRYDSKASISTQIFAPMSLSISAAGNFLVSSFSVVGYERKVAMWKKTKKKFFDPWDGNMDSFHNDVRTYLNNQESGAGNVAVGKEAITKKNAINDFLASVLVGDMNRVSTKSNSDNLIRSFRVDRMQSIERAGGDNMPYDYGKVRANFMPADDEAAPAPFYSRLNRTVEQSQQNKASGAQWKATIKNSKPNADEMALVGINDLEDGKTYTRQEVLDYLKANEVVVKDVTLGEKKIEVSTGLQYYIDNHPQEQGILTGWRDWIKLSQRLKRRAKEYQRDSGRSGAEEYFQLSEEATLIAESLELGQAESQTHFSTYQLPGAKEGSYREVLLTVPEGKTRREKLDDVSAKSNRLLDGRSVAQLTETERAAYSVLEGEFYKIADNANESGGWRDGHSQYSDIANPLVRLRLNERVTADGKRMLFLEEVQAPQKGEFEKMPKLFQDKWRDIAFKWALRHAAENGFDSVGWTTGEQQAARYDLSKHLSEVKARLASDASDIYEIKAYNNSGNEVIKRSVAKDDLESVLGKDLAGKIISDLPDTGNNVPSQKYKSYSGLDLKVGGEGLKKLYDVDFRNVVNNLPAVKKAGQKVGMGEIAEHQPDADAPFIVLRDTGAFYTRATSEQRAKELAKDVGGTYSTDSVKETIHSLPITPAIRDAVMGGQARFQPADTDYLAAVKSGDMATAQKMVDEAAKKAGSESNSDYRMQHTAPNKEDHSLLTIKDSGLVPKDYWEKPEWYTSSPEERTAFYNVTGSLRRAESRIQNGKSAKHVGLFVYRAVPKSVKDDSIRNGDWVTPSREYAVIEGKQINGGYRIISQHAKLSNLWWDGNSIAELGYDDGENYTYKNTRNNRKLIDPVTYDDAGNVIPLSKRFNEKSKDTRFQPADADYLAAVRAGDMKVVQGMVDQAAAAAGYGSDILKHGSRHTGFSEFDPERNREQPFANGKKPWFFAENESIARTYGPNIADYRLKLERPLEIHEVVGRDSDGEYQREAFMREDAYQALPEDIRALLEEAKDGDADTDSIVIEMLASGDAMGSYAKAFRAWGRDDNDGIIAYDTLDTMGPGDRGNIHIVFSPSQIKSADPITRDDQGNVIPLSQRFNEKSKDTRFQPADELSPEKLASLQSAKQYHGITRNINEAGYALPDGSLLDFSGRHQMQDSYEMRGESWVPKAGKKDWQAGSRYVDHREIQFDGPQPDATSGGDMMVAYQKLGAMRVDATSSLVDMEVRPTSAQESVIRRIAEQNGGNITVDLQDGNRKSGLFYEGAKPQKVLGDIRRFYSGEDLKSGARFQPADADYLAAVKAGDMKVVQGMVDEAAKAAGLVGGFYHGTIRKKFDVFSSDANTRNDFGRFGRGFYFTKDKRTAAVYAGKNPFSGGDFDIPSGATIYSVFLNLNNPKVVDARDVVMPETKDEAQAVARQLIGEGYDGVIGTVIGKIESPNTEYVVFSPSQIKSADPVTRDAQGNVIPLSQRFNTTSEDIRYQPADENPTEAVQKLKAQGKSPSEIARQLNLTRSQVKNYAKGKVPPPREKREPLTFDTEHTGIEEAERVMPWHTTERDTDLVNSDSIEAKWKAQDAADLEVVGIPFQFQNGVATVVKVSQSRKSLSRYARVEVELKPGIPESALPEDVWFDSDTRIATVKVRLSDHRLPDHYAPSDAMVAYGMGPVRNKMDELAIRARTGASFIASSYEEAMKKVIPAALQYLGQESRATLRQPGQSKPTGVTD